MFSMILLIKSPLLCMLRSLSYLQAARSHLPRCSAPGVGREFDLDFFMKVVQDNGAFVLIL